MSAAAIRTDRDATAPRRSSAALPWLALAVLTAAFLVINNAYYVRNTRIPTYDEAWYLENSLRLYHSLASHDFRGFVHFYRSGFQAKAPLISLLPLPFYALFGPSRLAALQVNSLFLIISSVYLFLLGRRLFSAAEGLVAVIFYQTMPLACGLSRVLMTEYGLAALVVAWLYYLVKSEQLHRGAVNFTLGALAGFGLLTKVLFPAFIAGPFLAAYIRRPRGAAPAPSAEEFPPWRFCSRWPLAAIIVPGAVVAGTWYAFNLKNVLGFALGNARWEMVAGYNAAGARVATRTLQFVNQGLSAPYAIALAVLGTVALARILHRGKSTVARMVRDEGTILLLSWLVPPLAALIIGSNFELRFALPILPAIALALAATVAGSVNSQAARAGVLLVVLVLPLRLFAGVSFPASAQQRRHPLRMGPLQLFDRDLGWAHPPDGLGDWGQVRIIEAIHRLDVNPSGAHYAVVGVEHPYLNANLLSYLNAYSAYPLNFTSLGYNEASVSRAIERLYGFRARFLVIAEGFQAWELTDFLNLVNDDLRARIERGELPFQLRERIPLHGHVQGLLYERQPGPDRFASQVEPGAPSHPLGARFEGGPRLLGFDWKRKNHDWAELSLYWSALETSSRSYQVKLEFHIGPYTVHLADHLMGTGPEYTGAWKGTDVLKETQYIYAPSFHPVSARLSLLASGSNQALPASMDGDTGRQEELALQF